MKIRKTHVKNVQIDTSVYLPLTADIFSGFIRKQSGFSLLGRHGPFCETLVVCQIMKCKEASLACIQRDIKSIFVLSQYHLLGWYRVN